MNILIAAASSDVGCAFIKYLAHRAKEGFFGDEKVTVFAHYYQSLSKLEELSEWLTAEGSSIEFLPIRADLSKPQSGTDMNDGLVENLPAIPDYFIYLPAGKFEYTRLKQLDTDKLRKEMQLNTYSFLEIAQKLLPAMKKKPKAGILTMLTSAVTDELPPKYLTDYVVTKYALLGATRALIAEYASDKLTIDYVAPSMMDTRFLKNIDPLIKRLAASQAENGRLLMPEEICEEMFDKIFK